MILYCLFYLNEVCPTALRSTGSMDITMYKLFGQSKHTEWKLYMSPGLQFHPWNFLWSDKVIGPPGFYKSQLIYEIINSTDTW